MQCALIREQFTNLLGAYFNILQLAIIFFLIIYSGHKALETRFPLLFYMVCCWEGREGGREEKRVGEGGKKRRDGRWEGGEGGMEGGGEVGEGGEGGRGREPVFKTASLTTQLVINKGKMNLGMFEYYM